MKLKVVFGLLDTKEIFWWKDVSDFPNLINFSGKNFEFSFYREAKPDFDYEFTFSELGTWDPHYNTICDTWNELFGSETSGCECGSSFTSYPNGHMLYCPRWSKTEI